MPSVRVDLYEGYLPHSERTSFLAFHFRLLNSKMSYIICFITGSLKLEFVK